MNPSPPQVTSPARLRVIALALIGGPVVFAAVAAVLLSQGLMRDVARVGPMVGIALTAVAVVNLVVAFPVRTALFRRTGAAEGDERLRRYGVATLVFFAMLESVMLLGVLAWFLTHDPVPGVVVAVLGFAVAVCSLPDDEQLESLGL